MLTAIVDGKEAIPIRAIPFITGWLISPDVVAKTLANTDTWITRLKDINSYHILQDNNYALILPKEWDCIEADLEILATKLKSTEKFDQENYALWRRDSILTLPPNCFVWKDDFIDAFKKSYSLQKMTFIIERHGDRELNFTPRIDNQLLEIVMEGFLPQQNDATEADDKTDINEIGHRSLQIEVILTVIAALEYEPLKIPDGGKARVKSVCLSRPRLFTSASFDHTWKDGVSQGLFRLLNHNKYSRDS